MSYIPLLINIPQRLLCNKSKYNRTSRKSCVVPEKAMVMGKQSIASASLNRKSVVKVTLFRCPRHVKPRISCSDLVSLHPLSFFCLLKIPVEFFTDKLALYYTIQSLRRISGNDTKPITSFAYQNDPLTCAVQSIDIPPGNNLLNFSISVQFPKIIVY